MDVLFQTDLSAPASLIVFVPDRRKNGIAAWRPDEDCPELCDAVPRLAHDPALRDVTGAADRVWMLYDGPDGAVSRIAAAGLGAPGGVEVGDLLGDAVRRAAGAAARRCREAGPEDIALSVPCLNVLAPDELPRLVEEAVFGVLNGLYRQTTWKTRQPSELPRPEDPKHLILWSPEELPEAVRTAALRGLAAARAVRLARDLGNEPPNRLTPSNLAEAAVFTAQRYSMNCQQVFGELTQEMGALRAVEAGSMDEARLVILEHEPKGHMDEAPLIVVGKGLTFDSGGISLKPSAGMEAMKGDMCGAAAVIGLIDALAALRVPRRVIGVVVCAENMPGPRAMRPGDVVVTLSGKTVEIVNTDAEGRLVLCDALTYVQRHWKPSLLIDAATLTGACVTALGGEVGGVFATDPVLAERIREAGRAVGEPWWPLPLERRYFENLKSETADFANAGTREGGACSAAAFLRQFVEDDVPWVHLDIAGPAFVKQKTARTPAGAIGFAVRTLLELVLREVAARDEDVGAE